MSLLGFGLAYAEIRRRSHPLGFAALADGAPRRPCIVVKLGGSAITVKDKLETLNGAGLQTTAQQIAEAVDDHDIQLVLLHGAGSFGHFQAKKYGISKGDRHAAWSFGFADTRRSVTFLNHLVVSSLIDKGVPAVGLSPFPSTSLANKSLESPGVLPLAREVLARKLVPVLHGDAVFDSVQGSAIVSGDIILEALCTDLAPDCAVFLTDVPGVFTKPPGEPGAELIEEIIVATDGSCTLPTMSTADHDVTGGIEEKLKTAIAVALKGIPVYIVQVGTPNAAQALRGEKPQVATLIRLQH